jgi:lipopolysaccharide/colanic/teichoic acid biosynthesis glycosyltransferase
VIQHSLKSILDRIAAAAALILLLPFFLLIAAAIKIAMPGPVFFRQRRVGRQGREFDLNKFRTMVVGAEQMGLGLLIEKDDARIPPLGSFLRRWSLDELPQLWNVLKADMSLVGPRPTVPVQVAQYTKRQRRRLEVRPGLTGWAQVNGRNELSWPERIEMDIWYIDHWSLGLDLKILLRTPGLLLKGENVYASDLSKFEIGKK